MNEMLLRGCMLKNTGEVLGLVVYSGAETRIQQNSAETPLKYGEVHKHSMTRHSCSAGPMLRSVQGHDRDHACLSCFIDNWVRNIKLLFLESTRPLRLTPS
jgi:magnesium-transporting ATPase (P-type)